MPCAEFAFPSIEYHSKVPLSIVISALSILPAVGESGMRRGRLVCRARHISAHALPKKAERTSLELSFPDDPPSHYIRLNSKEATARLSPQMTTHPLASVAILLFLASLASARNDANPRPLNARKTRQRPLPVLTPATAFIDPSPLAARTVPPFLKPSASDVVVNMAEGESNDENVKVGSSEHYQGFLSRKVDEEPEERITGDAALGPTLKLAGQVTAVLVLLTVGFLASNGII